MKNKTRNALILSVLSLVLCFTMLIGTTYAWFTDSVSSGTNKIIAGNLDIEAKYLTAANADPATDANWADLTGATRIFYAIDGDNDLWEPGHTEVAYIQVTNKGTLDAKYNISVLYEETGAVNVAGEAFLLSDYLSFGSTAPATTASTYENRTAARAAVVANATLADYSVSNQSLAAGATNYIALVIYMPEDVGNAANYRGTAPEIDFSINIVASQLVSENDSFGNDYDGSATYPVVASGKTVYTAAAPTTVSIPSVGSATIPAGTALEANGAAVEDNTELVLTVEETEDDGNIAVATGDSTTSYEVTLEAVTASGNYKVSSTDNAIITKLYIGVVDLTGFYHNGIEMTPVTSEADVDANGEYYYNPSTGYITMATTSFSPFTSVYKFDGGLGTEAYPYLISAVDHWNAITAAKYYALTNNIDFKETAPKAKNGYSTTASTVIDGKGFTISNAAGPLFNQDWCYNLIVKDLVLSDCVSNSSLIMNAGLYSTTIGTTFDNVDVIGCTAKGGCFFVPWCYENYNLTFVGCDIENSVVNDDKGAQGFVAAFCGNSKATVVVDQCSLSNVLVKSSNFECGGFVSGYSGGTVKNSTVSADTIIAQYNSKSKAVAIGASVTTIENCEFYGTIKTSNSSTAYFQGFTTGTWSELDPSFVGTDFVISENGSITYTGNKEFSTIKVYQRINTDRMKNGEYENGGFPIGLAATKTFTTSSMENAIDIVKDVKNVAPEYADKLGYAVTELPEGLTFNSNGFAISNDGTLYFDASEKDSWTSIISGTYNNATPSKITVTVFYAVYDANDVLIGTTYSTYTVAPQA